MGIVTGPIRRGDGIAAAVALVDPKFPHNVGAAVRAASCYGVRQVWFSGDRVRLDGAKRQRLPREERMRGYKEVEVRQGDQFFDAFEDAVPVAVELRRNAEWLIDFVHPEQRFTCSGRRMDRWARPRWPTATGPGDSHPALRNLSAAVYTVLYDRHAKRVHDGLECLTRPRGTSMSRTTWPTPRSHLGRLAVAAVRGELLDEGESCVALAAEPSVTRIEKRSS